LIVEPRHQHLKNFPGVFSYVGKALNYWFRQIPCIFSSGEVPVSIKNMSTYNRTKLGVYKQGRNKE
jgi:hypothetical protein